MDPSHKILTTIALEECAGPPNKVICMVISLPSLRILSEHKRY